MCSLPPVGTKLAMAARFNDPDDSCKVLVATDAIGMGLNLNIRRLVFYSLQKLTMDPDNPSEKSMDVISVSQALQIAGRAGRFNTQWETGYVTCYHEEDMELMHSLLNQTPPEILQAGLHPTFDQVCTLRPVEFIKLDFQYLMSTKSTTRRIPLALYRFFTSTYSKTSI